MVSIRIPTLSQVLERFKLVMVTNTGRGVQQIWKAQKGTAVRVTIEVLPKRLRFNGQRYHCDKL